jgi:hypothetical protein
MGDGDRCYRMVDLGFGGSNAEISRHAKKQWRNRVENPPPRKDELTGSIWLNAEPVRAPEVDGQEVRLVRMPGGHRDMLLTGHHKRDGSVVVATVLYADYSRLPGVNEGDF